jgi:hypothetical protein
VPLAPVAVVDVAAAWDAKLAAILAYPSQLATAFGYVAVGSGRAEIDAALRAYARQRGGATLAERFWAPSAGAR